MILNTLSVPSGSSWLVGSSMTRMSGLSTITEASATRCIWPPLNSKGFFSASCRMLVIFMTSTTRSSISSGGTPKFSSPKATSSNRVSFTPLIWLKGFWNT